MKAKVHEDDESFPVWITKYFFTAGIQYSPTCRCSKMFPNMIAVPLVGGLNEEQHFHGNDWHRTREEAVAKALKMINSKRKSVEATLIKLDLLEKEMRL